MMLCSVHVFDCLYLFWFPHFKEQAPKEIIWQNIIWKVFWETGFLHPLAYMKNGWFEPGWLIFHAYFDCCGNMFWTKAVMILWELTGCCLCVMRNKSFSLAYILEIRLLYSKEYWFCSFFFQSYFLLLVIPTVNIEMLRCSCTICKVYTYLSG